MKKYIITETNTLLSIVDKLSGKIFSSNKETGYVITKIKTQSGELNPFVSVLLKRRGEIENEINKLYIVLKENKIQFKLKKVNPQRKDLYNVYEVVIEPLTRIFDRVKIENIHVQNIYYAPFVDITTILSLYGKTSIINQKSHKFQSLIESTLNRYNYFITKVNFGFFFAVNSHLMNCLADEKVPYFLQDAHFRTFYKERNFFNPDGKLKEKVIDQMLESLLLQNVKSVLIQPFFNKRGTLLGYVEIQSNLPSLGSPNLSEEIEPATGIDALMNYIEQQCEDFNFELELDYVKDWTFILEKGNILDISQDGRGLGVLLPEGENYSFFESGYKLKFSILINQTEYSFFAGIRNIKTGEGGYRLGIRIYNCYPVDGIQLLSSYANMIIQKNTIS